MKILVIGSGGREHALIKKIKQSPKAEMIYALPGNGGIEKDAICVPIKVTDIPAVVDFAKQNNIDYVVVAPDDPLVAGMVDALEDAGISCFGPRANAAIIEGSKVFSKNLMQKYGIPTAKYEVFDDPSKAKEYIEEQSLPIVIKANGLALGKGVIIAETKQKALDAISSIMQEKIFGQSGDSIVVEEFLQGPEVSVLCFTDGDCIVPMVSSMDHKRAKDFDEGLNTGGMGTIAPNPYYTNDIAKICYNDIFLPTINAMNSEGRPFKGCLYFGLMLTQNGPKVIEYNCRFGDPETQVVLPLLKSDLLEIMLATTDKTLDKQEIDFSCGAACCVIAASDGYPVKYTSGHEITIDDDIQSDVYFAGAKKDNEKTVTSGGRVLGVTAVASDLETAIAKAYSDIKKVHFANMYYRKDIGAAALKKIKEQ